MKKIGVLGLGWLGKPLAEELQKEGFQVSGTTTTTAKKLQLLKEGFQAFQIQIEADRIVGEAELFFRNLDVLILNIPPKIPKDDISTYLKKIKRLHIEILKHQIKKVIYISSTSVFEDALNFPVYNEQSTPNAKSPKALQLIKAEQTFIKTPEFETAVVRFGGLVGNQRHPVYYLAGKSNLANPAAPINLIHLTDCINLIKTIIKANKFNQVFHGVQSSPESKATFYKKAAQKRSLELPFFDKKVNVGKKITAEFTSNLLSIEFNNSVY